MIGATGIIASASGLRWLTPGSGPPRRDGAPTLRLHLQDVVLELASLELGAGCRAADRLRVRRARRGDRRRRARGTTHLAGSLAGFAFTLDSLDLTVVQNGVTG